MQRVDLAIIGGGLVGASLALALQGEAKARGWRISLIEPFAPGAGYQPSYDARSTALSYGTRLIYQRFGLWQAISERAEPILQIHVSDRGRFAAARLRAKDEGVPALGYVVENAWLGQCLWQALDQQVVSWRTPAQVTRLDALEKGYRLTLDDESSLECDLAILADGGRSGLREQLGIGVSHRPYGQSALIANISPQDDHQGRPSSASPQTGRWPCCRWRTSAVRWSGLAQRQTPNACCGWMRQAFSRNCSRPSVIVSAPCARSVRGICTCWR